MGESAALAEGREGRVAFRQGAIVDGNRERDLPECLPVGALDPLAFAFLDPAEGTVGRLPDFSAIAAELLREVERRGRLAEAIVCRDLPVCGVGQFKVQHRRSTRHAHFGRAT